MARKLIIHDEAPWVRGEWEGREFLYQPKGKKGGIHIKFGGSAPVRIGIPLLRAIQRHIVSKK